jgi:hypothetical protein
MCAALLVGRDGATSTEAGESAARTVAAFVVALAAVALLSAQYAEVAETAPGTGCGSRRSGAGRPMLVRVAPIAAQPHGQAG